MLPVQTWPVLSACASYGDEYFCGTDHSMNSPDFVSNIATLSPHHSANHNRSCASMRPRRGRACVVGTMNAVDLPVFASIFQMYWLGKSARYALFCESV